ncbi:MAG TPA: SRPBCC family protein [Acidisarcina sp.]
MSQALLNETDAAAGKTVTHNTFVIERTYPTTPEKVFDAFAEAATKRRWYAEGERHDIEEFEMDFRPGGVERSRYLMKAGTPIAGFMLVNEGTYLDIVANRRIVTAAVMSLGDKRISATLVTIELVPENDARSTKLICTHQGAFFEGADGPEMRRGGWNHLFDKLAVELAR